MIFIGISDAQINFPPTTNQSIVKEKEPNFCQVGKLE